MRSDLLAAVRYCCQTDTALGIDASCLVLCTFAMTSMSRLRVVAICSNLAFICYGWHAGLWPIFVLHAILLPLNCRRLAQSRATMTGRMGPAAAASWGVPGSN
jgi:hypothetical protein